MCTIFSRFWVLGLYWGFDVLLAGYDVVLLLLCDLLLLVPPIFDIEIVFYWWFPIGMCFLIGDRICIVVCV